MINFRLQSVCNPCYWETVTNRHITWDVAGTGKFTLQCTSKLTHILFLYCRALIEIKVYIHLRIYRFSKCYVFCFMLFIKAVLLRTCYENNRKHRGNFYQKSLDMYVKSITEVFSTSATCNSFNNNPDLKWKSDNELQKSKY